MKRLLVFVFIGILFQGCISLHNGVIAPNSVDVSTDNFQIIKTIDGKATAGYFLGLGGGGRKGLVKEAKRDMYKNHPPSPNEMITNITVDDKKLFFLGGLYIEHTVFVSADVVRFGEYVNKKDKSSSINSKPKSNELKSSTQENKSIPSNNPNEVNKMTKLLDIQSLKKATNIYYDRGYGKMLNIKIKEIVSSSSTYVKYSITYTTEKGVLKTKNIPHNFLSFEYEDRYVNFGNLSRE